MFKFLGERSLNFFSQLGELSLLNFRVIRLTYKFRVHLRNTLDQMLQLGVKSLPITVATAMFVGMAFTVQVVREFLKFGAAQMIGGVVALAVWRELGPLMTGVIVAGRVGAAITAEIGTMKVTEQVEALESMSQDPVEYLVVPRVLAVTLLLPLLVGVADVTGFLGGFLVATRSPQVNPFGYFHSADIMLRTADITGGMIKALLFGYVISLISCFMGLRAKAGAKGVGEITTRSVVISLVSVFVLNYFMSLVLFK